MVYRLSLFWGISAGLFLSLILLNFVVFVDQFDTHLAEHLLGLCTIVVAAFAHYAFDAAVDDEHGTGAAGRHAAVERAAIQGDAPSGGLTDGVLLGMNRADAVLGDATILVDDLAEKVSHIIAVGQSLG